MPINNLEEASSTYNFFKSPTFRFREEQVNQDDVYHARADQNQIELPADLVQSHWRSDQCNLGGQIETRQAKRNSLRPKMIREDFGDVDVLCGVDEEAPPEDVEEDEEDGSSQTSGVVCVEERGCQGA
jgi:hypothetical protein